MTKKHNNLSSDKPLTEISDDALGYSFFAKSLADSLYKGSFDDGIVLSIYGEWGSGKSTALSFFESHLKELDQDISILHFNPWWFSGEEALLKSFFSQLRSLFSNWKSRGKELAKKVGIIADVLAKAPIAEAKAVDALLKKLLGSDLNSIKQEIEDLLKVEKRKIIVIIDDIDRLTGDEVKQLFKLVKAVANFPHIAYVLAFDRNVVAKSIEKALNVNGNDYIEKIIQVPFELPAPDQGELSKLFFDKINLIFSDVPEEEHDHTYFGNLYHDGIKYFLTTPRDVVRLTNTLSITYPPVAGEVSYCDFIAIESIRVFEPEIYDFIRRNEHLFSGVVSESRNSQVERESNQKLLQEVFTKAKNTTHVNIKAFLERMFPKVESITGNMMYGYDHMPFWRKEKKICSPDLFSTFFRFSLPINSISFNEINSVVCRTVELTDLVDDFQTLAIEILPNGKSKISVVLDRILDYLDDLNETQLKNLISMIFLIGDELLLECDQSQEMFSFGGNDIRLGRLMYQCLRKLSNDTEVRFEALKVAYENGNAVIMMCHEAVSLGQQHGKYSNKEDVKDDYLIELNHQEELEKLSLSKIRELSKTNKLIINHNTVDLLYSWKGWADESEPQKWIKKKLDENPKDLIFLLSGFVTKSHSHAWGDRVSKTITRLNVKNLSTFVDLEFAKSIVSSLLSTSENNDRKCLDLFLTECEAFKQDPDTFNRQ
ncbi:KAP family P-loop domain protein [Colwellia asteriadis]|uniref:KAP family P-loop domain protein n=1 Tax=Colwellia asteriadis TaxID=517723 RepID=A0ABN1L869_9GAMM